MKFILNAIVWTCMHTYTFTMDPGFTKMSTAIAHVREKVIPYMFAELQACPENDALMQEYRKLLAKPFPKLNLTDEEPKQKNIRTQIQVQMKKYAILREKCAALRKKAAHD